MQIPQGPQDCGSQAASLPRSGPGSSRVGVLTLGSRAERSGSPGSWWRIDYPEVDLAAKKKMCPVKTNLFKNIIASL